MHQEAMKHKEADENERATKKGMDLWNATSQKDLEKVRKILRGDEGPVLINFRDPELGRTPFYRACGFAGDPEIVREFLRLPDVDVNLPITAKATPFFIACQEGHVDVVRLLLGDQRIDPILADRDDVTPLFMAAQKGHVEIVKMLLEDPREIPVNQQNVEGTSPLYIACEMGHVAIVQLLLARPELDPNLSVNEGETPFYVACQEGHVEIVRLLLSDRRVEPGRVSSGNVTPFYIAAQEGHVAVVEELLRDGRSRGQVNETKEGSFTPLFIACYEGRAGVVEVLLREGEGVQVNLANEDGSSPFMAACERGHLEIVKMMLECPRVAVDQVDLLGTSPFWIACQNGHVGVVREIIASGRVFDPLVRSVEGEEAWHGLSPSEIASLNGYNELADLVAQYIHHPLDVKLKIRLESGFAGIFLLSFFYLPAVACLVPLTSFLCLFSSFSTLAEVFALIVLICDAYVSVVSNSENDSEAVRFFKIASKLPMELQMGLSYRIFKSSKDVLSVAETETALRKSFKCLASFSLQ